MSVAAKNKKTTRRRLADVTECALKAGIGAARRPRTLIESPRTTVTEKTSSTARDGLAKLLEGPALRSLPELPFVASQSSGGTDGKGGGRMGAKKKFHILRTGAASARTPWPQPRRPSFWEPSALSRCFAPAPRSSAPFWPAQSRRRPRSSGSTSRRGSGSGPPCAS